VVEQTKIINGFIQIQFKNIILLENLLDG